MALTRKTIYLHADNSELSDMWEPEAPQQKEWHYVAYEVAVDLEVDLESGKALIISVNGSKLLEPVSA
jgi:hypothetical protein